MKKRMLMVFGWIRMNGSVMGLFDFIRSIDRTEWDVDVFMTDPVVHDGLELPDNIHVLPADIHAVIESVSLREAVLYALRRGRIDLVIKRITYTVLHKHFGLFQDWSLIRSARMQPKKYDVAVCATLGWLLEYTAQKVNADRKLLWIDTDIRFGTWVDLWRKSQPLVRQMSAVICVSEATTDMMRKDNPCLANKIFHIPYVVNQKGIIDKAQRAEPVPDKKCFRLVTVGRYCEQKGTRIIPSIAQKLIEYGLKFEWYIVAPGWMRVRKEVEDDLSCRNLCGSLFFLEGLVNPYPMMASADLYVQPSLYEGFGLTVSEAMCLGKYIVATDIPEFREQIISDDLGSFAKFDVNDFAAKIVEGVRKIQMKKVSVDYRTPYSYANTYRHFLNVLQSVGCLVP